MTKRIVWADLAVLPALCALVIVLFLSGQIAGKLITHRLLHSDAKQSVYAWRDYVAARLGPNFEYITENEAAGEPDSPFKPHENGGVSSVLSSSIIDARGHVVVPDSTTPRHLFEFPTVQEQVIFQRMLDTGTLQYFPPGSAISERAGETSHWERFGTKPGNDRTIFYVPLMDNGRAYGGLRLDVGQAAATVLVSNLYSARIIISGILSAIGLVTVLIILWRRIRERWTAESEIRFLAMHDSLTKLPNRARFNKQLDVALRRARNNRTTIAVLCFDVDNFKEINDTLGHPAGDSVLRSIAGRILAVSGRDSTVARLSGDEFAVFVENVGSKAVAAQIAERYLRSAAIPHDIGSHELVCTISIGIALAPADGTDTDTLMKNADLALYQSKDDGRNTARFFTIDMDEDLRQRRLIEEKMRKGLGTDQFKVVYQPQFNLRTGAITGYEALTRWTDPELGEVSPSVFIPIAEASGLIARLDEWVLRTACLSATKWAEPNMIAVNLSAAQFRSGDVAGMVERTLRDTGLPAGRLEVEITETVLLHNTDFAQDTLTRLRELGVSIAMDDFGTGYSSLSYLSRFPIDNIKIDQSFVQQLGQDENTVAIVNAIVSLGKSLQITITAEGVETYDQLAHLRAAGCHLVQGYLFGRPNATVKTDVPEVLRMQESLNVAAG